MHPSGPRSTTFCLWTGSITPFGSTWVACTSRQPSGSPRGLVQGLGLQCERLLNSVAPPAMIAGWVVKGGEL